MQEERSLELLEEENTRLKSDNEMLLAIIAQMKNTLNRLITRYMTDRQYN